MREHFALDPCGFAVEKQGPLKTLPSLLFTLALSGLGSLGAPAADAPAGSPVFGRHDFIEYTAGDLPIVISAPHGGREKPDEIPSRTTGVLDIDTNTQELARAVEAELRARTGRKPHVVICRLHRSKLDCNREIVEAAAGSAVAETAWTEYHGFIEKACATAVAKYGRAFYLDLHGHGHKYARLELGYLHSAETLALPDAELNTPATIAAGSIRLLAAQSKRPYVELLRGPRSLGSLFEAQGFPATPSPAHPTPAVPFFNGGYSVRRHTAEGGKVAGLQIECNLKGVRDTAENRERFARALVTVLDTYLAEHWDLKLNARPAAAR